MSFSSDTKRLLAGLPVKSKCCRRAQEAGRQLFSSIEDAGTLDTVIKAEEGFQCSQGAHHFARGLFLGYGSVTNPSRGYHLELSFREEAQRDAAAAYIAEAFGAAPKKTARKAQYIAYFKESGVIEDFLACIGATKAVFDLMNSKILRELRNDANRVANCETANIGKSISASQRSIAAIRELAAAGQLSGLPPELQHTAELRLANEEASLTELGAKMEPPISKSGMSHRLTKIMEYYREYKERGG